MTRTKKCSDYTEKKPNLSFSSKSQMPIKITNHHGAICVIGCVVGYEKKRGV